MRVLRRCFGFLSAATFGLAAGGLLAGLMLAGLSAVSGSAVEEGEGPVPLTLATTQTPDQRASGLP